tara:strand:- start:22125 stop:23024 length:900 start_codon:yes stop_codon:yes gene_type:complete
MASAATRLLLWVTTIASVPLYFVLIVPEGLLMQVAGGVLILLLVSLLLFTGRRPIPAAQTKSPVVIEQGSGFGDIELPPAVLSEESTGEIRDAKIRRSRGRKTSPEPPLPAQSEQLPPLPSPVSMDEGPVLVAPGDDVEGVARVHVASSDPELQAEAEVDQYLAQQRARRSVFRERLYHERRIEKSKRLAEQARKWTDLEDGEDLSTLTSIPGHGLAVMYEPEDPDPTIPQGVSYVRIDDERVLKVRISLDVPGSPDSVEELESEQPMDESSMPLPPAPGVAMPPPPLPDLPPPVRPDE